MSEMLTGAKSNFATIGMTGDISLFEYCTLSQNKDTQIPNIIDWVLHEEKSAGQYFYHHTFIFFLSEYRSSLS